MTLFPEMIEAGIKCGITGKAVEKGIIELEAVNIRNYTNDKKHLKVDDYIYGGGAGLLMQAQPIWDCYLDIKKRIQKDRERRAANGLCANSENGKKPVRVIYMTPQAKVLTQETVMDLAKEDELIILCGHYEGVDERVLEEIVTDNVSIGDYVLTGGELPAMVLIDAVSRFVPGVLHNSESAETDSFQNGLLEYPQYSRPEIWNGKQVPGVLLTGDHEKVDEWRLEQSLERTKERRPELYEAYMASHETKSPKKKSGRK